MDIIITGAAGNLGQTLITKLDRKIVGIDKKNCPKNIKGVEWVKSDINNIDLSVYNKPLVIHTAALVDYSAKYSDLFQINVLGVKSVFEQVEKAGGKMIFISSTAVYGKKNLVLPVKEEHSRNPTDNYGLTKMYAEDIVRDKSVILRPCPIYGPRFTKGYFKIFESIKKEKMVLLGNGENYVPVINSMDVANAIELFIKKYKMGVYNVSPDKTLTQKQLFNICAEYLKVKKPEKKFPVWLAKIRYIFNKDMNEYVDMLSSNRLYSNKKLKDLGWKEKTNIENGIKKMIDIWRG